MKDLKAQRKALRAQVRERRRLLKEQMSSHPAVVRARRRRKFFRLLVLLVVLALLLLIQCDCGKGNRGPAVERVPVQEPIELPQDAGTKKKKFSTKVKSLQRPDFGKNELALRKWLEAIQMQVAARHERLAVCFSKVDGPGALRWTFSINTNSGRVSDHELEPVGASATLSSAQEKCIIDVLSYPAFDLEEAPKEGVPSRIALMLEF